MAAINSHSENNNNFVLIKYIYSAGVGRTGTFITLGCMMPMIREQSLVDVYNFVNRMRDSRNRMVQVEVSICSSYKFGICFFINKNVFIGSVCVYSRSTARIHSAW